MKSILTGFEEFVGKLRQFRGIDPESLGEIRTRSPLLLLFGRDQLQIAECDRMKEHPDAAVGSDRLRDRVDRLSPLVCTDRIGVPDMKSRAERGQLVEMRLDVLHRAATISMNDQDIQAGTRKALCRR